MFKGILQRHNTNAIFGLGGGGGGNQTVTQRLPPVIEGALQFGLTQPGGAIDLFQGGGPAIFEGPRRAELDPLQLQAQNQALDVSRGTLGELLGPAQQSFSNILSPEFLSPETNPALMATMDAATRPFIERFTEEIAPGSILQDIGFGQTGGTRGQVERGVALGKLGQAAMDTRARIASDAFQRGVGQQLQAGQLLPTLTSQSLLPSEVMERVGAFNRAEDQAAIDEEMQLFREREARAEENLNRFLARVTGAGSLGGGTTTTSGGGGGLGFLGAGAGGALTGLGTAAALQGAAPAGGLFAAGGALGGPLGLGLLAGLGALGGGLLGG